MGNSAGESRVYSVLAKCFHNLILSSSGWDINGRELSVDFTLKEIELKMIHFGWISVVNFFFIWSFIAAVFCHELTERWFELEMDLPNVYNAQQLIIETFLQVPPYRVWSSYWEECGAGGGLPWVHIIRVNLKVPVSCACPFKWWVNLAHYSLFLVLLIRLGWDWGRKPRSADPSIFLCRQKAPQNCFTAILAYY